VHCNQLLCSAAATRRPSEHTKRADTLDRLMYRTKYLATAMCCANSQFLCNLALDVLYHNTYAGTMKTLGHKFLCPDYNVKRAFFFP
jgi:hypothetical protein